MSLIPTPWEAATGPQKLRAALEQRGCALLGWRDAAREAAMSPWTFAETLLRETPRMVERQPIRAVEGGRSFASSMVFTPLHTDSQLHLGAPAAVQVMACARPAAQGGESHLIDAWALCEQIEREDPELFEQLVHAPRRHPFVFGDLLGPTLALRGGALTFTHSPKSLPSDPVAPRLARFLERAPRVTVRVEADQVLVVNNHRMLHGRAAFQDPGRAFVRLLVWSTTPCGEHARFRALADARARALTASLASASPRVRARFGVAEQPGGEAARRMSVVLELLRGVPPGVLAAREKVDEPELYAWRDAALLGALQGVNAVGPVAPEEEAAALASGLHATARTRGR